MVRRFSITCEDGLARQVTALAHEYRLSEEEVLEQLIDVGLEHLGK